MTKAIIPRAEYHDNGLLGDQTDALKHIFGQALRGFMEADVEQRVGVQRYERGDMDAVVHISTHLKRLIALYPPHIEMEDKRFFAPAMGYFSPEEKERMLDDAYDHDADMAHKKYVDMVVKYEGQ